MGSFPGEKATGPLKKRPFFMVQTGLYEIAQRACPSAQDVWRMEDRNKKTHVALEVVQCPSSCFVFLRKYARMQHASLPDSTICFPGWRQVRREPIARAGGTTLCQTGMVWDVWGGGRGRIQG